MTDPGEDAVEAIERAVYAAGKLAAAHRPEDVPQPDTEEVERLRLDNDGLAGMLDEMEKERA